MKTPELAPGPEEKSGKSNGGNSKNNEQQFKLPNKREMKQFDKGYEVASSVALSTISKATNKTSGGNVNKHCKLCHKKIAGNNWAVHKRTHSEESVPFDKCSGLSC